MKTILHKAECRGLSKYDWLTSYHSFSFSNYYNPERIHFGALRVLNDDVIAGGTGFGTHPHDNMEIITIPLSGALEHKDSMGNGSVIKTGEIQHMSAGKGITHSEFNPSKTESGNFLQIWIFPEIYDIEPVYQQIKINENDFLNNLKIIASPDGESNSIKINQQAWLSIIQTEQSTANEYSFHVNTKIGVYCFVIEGGLKVGEIKANKRDALGVWDCTNFEYQATENSKILFIEVPMR